jgi:hypothetical protein
MVLAAVAGARGSPDCELEEEETRRGGRPDQVGDRV